MDKSAKNRTNKGKTGKMDDAAKDAKSLIEKVLGDISKASATKQIVLGASSGWVTGLLAMRVGKSAAFALGSGIILLQIAHEKGYVKINWDKITNQVDKVADKVEENITGQGPSWMDKAERFIDRKVDKAEDSLKKKQVQAKSWWSGITGDGACKLKEAHIFLVSFVAGVALGIGSS